MKNKNEKWIVNRPFPYRNYKVQQSIWMAYTQTYFDTEKCFALFNGLLLLITPTMSVVWLSLNIHNVLHVIPCINVWLLSIAYVRQFG